MGSEIKANQTQIKRIHIAKSQLKLSDENYREILSGYGVLSSKDLGYYQANDLIEKFKKMGWVEVFKPRPVRAEHVEIGIEGEKVVVYDKGWGRQKYEYLAGRDDSYPEPRVLRYIESHWKKVSRSGTEASLRALIKKVGKVDDITFLKKKGAQAVIQAIKSIEKGGK